MLAYDAATGLLLWETSLAKDVVHLLGVAGDALWASGEKLWRIQRVDGQSQLPLARGADAQGIWPRYPGGFEGLLAYFPVDSRIRPAHGGGYRPIELESRGIPSGNLVAAGEILLIAGSERLTALGPATMPRAGAQAALEPPQRQDARHSPCRERPPMAISAGMRMARQLMCEGVVHARGSRVCRHSQSGASI